jgi:PadR family transcriptional regulator, regulatory protein PadR
MTMDVNDPILATHLQEIRRGTVVVAVLASLRVRGYGYALLEELAAAGIEVDANTLYPLLRRLEKQGLLTSAWDTEGERPRKYYQASEAGNACLRILFDEWSRLDARLTGLLEQGAER